jgi:adenine specific DNA methylase Mod
MMAESSQNILYYGDNLDILRRYVKDETVDLVYLDPPFNSNANYNVLFAEKDGNKAASQIQAFSDTWTWTQESEAVFADIVTAGGRVALWGRGPSSRKRVRTRALTGGLSSRATNRGVLRA